MVGARGCFVRGTQNGARLCEGTNGALGESRAEPRPKIAPQGLGAKMPQGTRDGLTIALVGARRRFVRKSRNGARLCEGPQSVHGESRTKPYPKIAPEGRAAKRLEGHRDGWAIAFVGCEGEARLPDSEWGKVVQGSSRHPWGVMCRAPPKNSARRSRCQNAPRAPRRVGCSHSGGRGAFCPRDPGTGHGIAKGLGAPMGSCV